MKRYNITTVGSYEKDGQEKKTYPQVGKLVFFEANNGKPESFILELNMFPGTRFCVFPDTPKDGTQTSRPAQRSAPANEPPLETIEYPAEDVNPDDIPFR